MPNSPIALASDHAAVELKTLLKAHLEEAGYSVVDLGTQEGVPADYPDVANTMAHALRDKVAERGILLCGTGIGASISVNRYPFVRAALVHDAFGARLARQHNDANVLVMGGRTIGSEVAKECLDIFLGTEFEGGRHARRVEKMSHAPS